MSKISKKNREYKSIGDHHKFLSRIRKTLYYGKLPETDTLSLPVTELAAELFSEPQRGKSLNILHCNEAAIISRNACVSPCSLVLALLYLERLKSCNPDYLQRVAPSELFLVSLMISNKFLNDDGEGDEVFMDEWAQSGGVTVEDLVKFERNFLSAINWEIFVNEEAFWARLKVLEVTLAQRVGSTRGWFTYTELQNLLEFIDVYSLVYCISSFSLILFTTYIAGILSLVGSMYVVSNISGLYLANENVPVIKKTYPSVVDSALSIEEPSFNDSEILDSLDQLKTDNNEKLVMKSIDAVDVLKTSIFLASIKVPESRKSICNETDFDGDTEYVTWDWWNNPVMQWLSESSRLLGDISCLIKFRFSFHNRYFDMVVANAKKLDLEDHINKATAVRIQEQMERSWHKEWTDTLQKAVDCVKLLSYYFHNFKS